MRARLGAVALLVLLTVVGAVRADHDETEARLKSAGVSDRLRAKIHKSIDRAVTYLAGEQLPDGSFEKQSNITGVTLLATLALRHAGRPATHAPVAKAVAFLFDGKSPDVDAKRLGVYEAGLALLLLQAVGRPEPEAPAIASALVLGLDEETRWWGYDTPGAPHPGSAASPGGFRTRDPNLSTTQFAALGLWAARRMGVKVPPTVWRLHAQALIESQGDTGSWSYAVKREGGKLRPADDRKGYFTGTCMGLANLLLARAALRAEAPADALLAPLDRSTAAALDSLRSYAPGFLEDPRAGEPSQLGNPLGTRVRLPLHDAPGIGPFYSLYALEKACLFADLESFAPVEPPGEGDKKPGRGKGPKVTWYTATAEWLIAEQNADGGWGIEGRGSNVVDSALALLILVRSPSTSHPTAPREIDAKPRGAVTPAEKPPPGEGK
jgi:hypothetical protein